MRRSLTVLLAASLLLGMLIAARPAAAETIDERSAALGWQTEHAALIVRARHVADLAAEHGAIRARFEVLETVFGHATAGERIVIAAPDAGLPAPWTPDAEHLVFLKRGPDEDTYVSVSGSLGIRLIPPRGPETRFADLVAAYRATLTADGAVADADRLRELLVTWIEGDDAGIVWSAAVDLHRHAELHAGLTGAQRAAVLDAYRRHPIGKISKRALARAVADARAPGSLDALLDTLAQPGGRALRADVAEAVAALRDPGATTEVLARLRGANAALRENLALTLGVLGDGVAAGAVRALLADDDVSVRVEAAHALGLIARAVRTADPDARIDGRTALVAMLATSRTANAQKAATWALAQLDQPESYAQLRRIAKDDPRENVRRYAARYLERPRVSLILR